MILTNYYLKKQHGNGIIDTLLRPFTAEKYPGERHAYSLSPKTFGHAMNFMGPHTSLFPNRLNSDFTPKHESLPINISDLASMHHDISYFKAKKAYEANPTPQNRKNQLEKVWKAEINLYMKWIMI